MINLDEYLKRASSLRMKVNKPQIFNLKNEKDLIKLEALLESGEVNEVIDNYLEQNKELNLVKYPTKILSGENGIFDDFKKEDGVWIYFNWNKTLIHSLDKNDYEKLRLSRNDNFIKEDEALKIKQIVVGIAGLNVGNPGAVCLSQVGVEKMKLSDFDILSLSNLNRFRAGISDLENSKTDITAKQIYEINPFSQLEVYSDGITKENIDDFLNSPKIDLLIEEMDNLPLKILIREKAREYKIPVLMVTGNGPNIIIDIERYDLNNKQPLLNGLLKEEVVKRILTTEKNIFREKMSLARDFMGKEYLVEELRLSFDRVGVDLAGIPQLAEATFLRGAALSYFTRKIITEKENFSGRYNLRLDSIL